ncbi:hypothetical protein SAMN05192540_1535 [Maribacter dokdonensis]|uniref:Uncharacterized protein n=1 Tax=Maribacter dokdonensis TaxID=320912 RepID=A0A1H4M658_9FLAO|nr:hypothetical protein [Maribacter dokdonensis]SEB78423.1 hypothetical protein SAMN05192540_1535 [Maribacter dokdonensis]
MTYHIIKKSFGTEFCTWPDEIGLCVTDDLRDKIERARNILKYNRDIQKLYIKPSLKILSDQSFVDLKTDANFEKYSVIVEDIYVSYFVQSKWSKTISAEYDFTHLIPHPIVADLEEESAAHDADILEELGTQSPNILYEVQTLTASDGWLNTWSVVDENNENVPKTFTTRKAAQQEIDEHISDIQDAIESGDLDVMLEELRIVQISKP